MIIHCFTLLFAELEGPEQVPEQNITAQGTVTCSNIEDSISHWVSSITDATTVEKKKKRKYEHSNMSDVAVGDVEETVVECTDITPKKKKSKRKSDEQIDVDCIIESMETDEAVIVGKKKKRKHIVDGPADKKVKLQEEVMTDSPKVKKHKKKVKN